MNNKNIQIDIRLVWLIALLDLAISVYWLVKGAGSNSPHSIFLLILSSLLMQVLLISDMVKNQVFNKPFWILSMLFIPKWHNFFIWLKGAR